MEVLAVGLDKFEPAAVDLCRTGGEAALRRGRSHDAADHFLLILSEPVQDMAFGHEESVELAQGLRDDTTATGLAR